MTHPGDSVNVGCEFPFDLPAPGLGPDPTMVGEGRKGPLNSTFIVIKKARKGTYTNGLVACDPLQHHERATATVNPLDRH
jgi:hypothetical protein